MSIEVEERFWSKVDLSGDCWNWTANVSIGGRYGGFRLNGKNRPAHRVAYELVVGPIPDGLELDHLCRNTRCVRPDHLEPVTHAENMRRGLGWAGQNARKTHCATHGIPLERIGLSRGCRTCRREANWRYRVSKGGAGSVSEANRRAWGALTPEQRSERARKAWQLRRRRAHADPVTATIRAYVLARDAYRCVGVVVGMKGECQGVAEIDHVMNAGKGKRGPSIPSNLVSLCSFHHWRKTTNSKQWRPPLMEYLAKVERAA